MPISDNKPEFRHRLAARDLFLLGAILISYTLAAQARNPGPKLVVAEYRHNFGDIFAGQFMDYAFTIRNDGTAPLTLSDEVRHAPNASALRLSGPLPPLWNGFLGGPPALPESNTAKANTRAGFVLSGVMSSKPGPPNGGAAAPT